MLVYRRVPGVRKFETTVFLKMRGKTHRILTAAQFYTGATVKYGSHGD